MSIGEFPDFWRKILWSLDMTVDIHTVQVMSAVTTVNDDRDLSMMIDSHPSMSDHVSYPCHPFTD